MNRLVSVVGIAGTVSAAALSFAASAGVSCWNSVDDISSVQGANDWWYGYWVMPGMNFQLLTEYNVASPGWWSIDWLRPAPAYWTLVGPGVMHPNGAVANGGKTPSEHEAVLRWVSPITDTVTADVYLACLDVGGNGTNFKIRWNGNLIASVIVGPFDSAGFSIQTNVPVTPGETLDFILATPDGNALFDSTTVEVTITASSFFAPADLNNDCKVDGADLGLLLGAWDTPGPFADLNADGIVNGADLGLLLGAWT